MDSAAVNWLRPLQDFGSTRICLPHCHGMHSPKTNRSLNLFRPVNRTWPVDPGPASKLHQPLLKDQNPQANRLFKPAHNQALTRFIFRAALDYHQYITTTTTTT